MNRCRFARMGLVATALLLAAGCADEVKTEPPPPTTLPAGFGTATFTAAEPEAHIAICVENSVAAPGLVEIARQGIDTLLQELVRPGGNALPNDQARPAVGVAAWVMTDNGFNAERLLQTVVPAQTGIADSVDRSDNRDYANALRKAGTSRTAALAAVESAKEELNAAEVADPVEAIELAGCSGRAASLFATTPEVDERFLILLTTANVVERQDIGPGGRGSLGQLAGVDVTATILCETDAYCDYAAERIAFFVGLSGGEYTPVTGPVNVQGSSPEFDGTLRDVLTKLTSS